VFIDSEWSIVFVLFDIVDEFVVFGKDKVDTVLESDWEDGVVLKIFYESPGPLIILQIDDRAEQIFAVRQNNLVHDK
jgi:hypothetical protein